MFNPFDMLQGQNAAGMQGIGQQFGLTPDQTRRAMEALLPAFAFGLQRHDPEEPTGLLKLFASPILSQAVIRQAASASGVGGQALRQMLPMMAGMVVASIVHMLLNQQAPQPAPEPEPANPFLAGQAFWTDMMKGFLSPAGSPPGASRSEPAPPEPKSAGKPEAGKPEPGKASPGKSEPSKPDTGRPEGEPSGAAVAKQVDIFQQMLLTGAEVQEENVRAMRGIFDAFWTDGAPEPEKAAPPAPVAAPVKPPRAGPRTARPRTVKRD
ncbi:DUF937 domain-containing protein [Methylobacterium sp. sgz302541]|uniref:DUF937 domain-containing protein n=1 Tax=unclassified Methylobacterium TaxID=2615210 RepID=UPI003D32B37E